MPGDKSSADQGGEAQIEVEKKKLRKLIEANMIPVADKEELDKLKNESGKPFQEGDALWAAQKIEDELEIMFIKKGGNLVEVKVDLKNTPLEGIEYNRMKELLEGFSINVSRSFDVKSVFNRLKRKKDENEKKSDGEVAF